MSEIKNVGYTWPWMALNTLKCNRLTPLRFKGLTNGLNSMDATSNYCDWASV